MKIEFSITKQHIVSLVLAIAIVAGISYAVAQTPDPGHPIGEIDFTGGFTVPSGTVDIKDSVKLASGTNQKKIVYIGDPVGGRSDSNSPIALFGSAQSGWGSAYLGIDSPSGVFNIYPLSGAASSSFNRLHISFDDTGNGTLEVDGNIMLGGVLRSSWPTVSIDDTSCVEVPYSTSTHGGTMNQCPTDEPYVVVGVASGGYSCATGCGHLIGNIKCCKLVLK